MRKNCDTSTLTRRKNRRLLVENKISFLGPESELSIYDTYKKANKVGLAADQMMYCGMITGKKIMHDIDNDKSKIFLPHQSYIIKPKGYVEIDFPEAEENKPTTCLTIEISQEHVNEIFTKMKDLEYIQSINQNWECCSQNIHFHHSASTQMLLGKLVSLFIHNHPDKKVLLDLGISELVVRLLRKQGKGLLLDYANKEPDANGITAAIDYLKNNVTEPFDIDKLTKKACMSRSLLYIEFKNKLGCTPCDFYWKLRLHLAEKMLQSGKSVTYACYSSGFKDPGHFSRRFSQLFGCGPREYQKSYRTIK